MRLLVTRPIEDQDQTLEALKARGLEGVCAPVMVVDRIKGALPLPADAWQGLIITSRNSLRMLSEEELAPLKGLALFCVGRKTAELACNLGFRNLVHVQGRLEGLAEVIVQRCNPAGGAFLYLSAVHRTGHLEKELMEQGFSCHLHRLYETCAVAHFSEVIRHAIQDGFIDGVLLYSARTAQIFMDLVERDNLTQFAQDLRYYCLSKAVAAPVEARGYPLVVAETPNETSLLVCVQNDHNYLR
jgi:uroporphyrinogen-III synthase